MIKHRNKTQTLKNKSHFQFTEQNTKSVFSLFLHYYVLSYVSVFQMAISENIFNFTASSLRRIKQKRFLIDKTIA